jgi:REP element-mobilizing transposase RayT
MTTHVHLLVEAPGTGISAAMHWLLGVYAQRFNRRHRRKGHLYEERFRAWVIRDEAHLERAITYVLANPSRVGLCSQAADWPWSGPHVA